MLATDLKLAVDSVKDDLLVQTGQNALILYTERSLSRQRDLDNTR
jgi:hypothetical protein